MPLPKHRGNSNISQKSFVHLSLQDTATTRSPGNSPYGSTVRGSRPAEVSSGRPKHPPVLSPHANASSDLELFSDDTPDGFCGGGCMGGGD